MVNDIETINCDLLDKKKLYALSEIESELRHYIYSKHPPTMGG